MLNNDISPEYVHELLEDFNLPSTRENIHKIKLCIMIHRLKCTIYNLHAIYGFKKLVFRELSEVNFPPPPISVNSLDLPFYSNILESFQSDNYFSHPIYLYVPEKNKVTANVSMLNYVFRSHMFRRGLVSDCNFIIENDLEWYHYGGLMVSVSLFTAIKHLGAYIKDFNPK